MTSQTKTTAARTLIAVIYLLLICIMFYTGRTHTVLVDNKDIEGIAAIRSMTVTIGNESADFRRGERDKFLVKGQKLRITVTPMGSQSRSFVIALPLGQDTMLLSVPKLLAGAEPYIEPFDLYAQTATSGSRNTQEEEIPEAGF